MSKVFALGMRRPFFWTRQLGEQVRAELEQVLREAAPGEAVTIDLKGVQAFDSSFANEFFGRTNLRLATDYPGRCVVVENLSDDVRYDLEEALKSLGQIMVMRKGETLSLIGRVHPADRETFAMVVDHGGPITAAELRVRLEMNLTAVNERLGKLTTQGVLRRESATSPMGRVEYRYWPPG